MMATVIFEAKETEEGHNTGRIATRPFRHHVDFPNNRPNLTIPNSHTISIIYILQRRNG
jgi:hypothetical protein